MISAVLAAAVMIGGAMGLRMLWPRLSIRTATLIVIGFIFGVSLVLVLLGKVTVDKQRWKGCGRRLRCQISRSASDGKQSPSPDGEPAANSVTSCPSSTIALVRCATTRSVPPYNLGGTAL